MDEKIADVLMEFAYGSPVSLAREILRLRAEIDEAHRKRQAAAEYQRYHHRFLRGEI